MRFSTLAVAAAVSGANAQRPKDTPICDYYVTALLKDNSASNQAALLTKLVNTVVIGNYTMPNKNAVPGILAKGMVDGKEVNLAPYFNGDLASTNTGGNVGMSVNFLDGGGAEPLKKDMPANDKNSKQYFLITHLYEFFGALLGCSKQGMSGFDAYDGHASMYEVHKFMDLGKAEVDYFITQVALAAQSFGVDKDDITAVGEALNSIFNVKCGPATTVIKAQGPQLQSICIDPDSCTEAKNATCDKYKTPTKPGKATGSMGSGTMMPTGTGGMMPTQTMGGGNGGSGGSGGSGGNGGSGTGKPSAVPSAAAAANGYSLAAAVAGVAAFLL